MPNGMTILFDGNNEVAVMADDRHVNSTCGLCGTYNNNHRDDFYTEAGTNNNVLILYCLIIVLNSFNNLLR